MNCPYCGSEVRENEKFCQNCGARLEADVQSAGTAVEPAAEPVTGTAAVPASAPVDPSLGYKEFITSPYCTPDVNKNIKASWIILYVVAGLSLIVALFSKAPPLDAILIAGVAVWLMTTKSFAAGVTAFIVGIFELIFSSIAMGHLAGYFPAIAGVYALTATLKAKKQYQTYQQGKTQR